MEHTQLDVRYTPVYGSSLRRQYSESYRAGDFKDLMADYSTTVRGIPILFAGGCWARRQLHAGIRYVSVASKLSISLASVKGA